MSHPVQEEDRVAVGLIVAVAAISLIIFGLGALWSVSIQRDMMKSIVTAPHIYGPTGAGKPEVGLVYQVPFDKSHYAADKVNEKKVPLDSYGWIDKKAGTVHIPIGTAIERYVSQAGGAK